MLTMVEPIPVDAVMFVFLGLACWVWYENLRAFARKSREQRRAREMDMCKEE